MPWDPADNTYAGSAAIPSLTIAAGTANNAVVDVGGAFAQATLNDNFADIATKLNAILVALRDAEIIVE